MGHGHPTHFKPVEYYRFNDKGKKITLGILVLGIVLLVLGLVLAAGKDYSAHPGAGHDGHHSSVQVPAKTVSAHEEEAAKAGHDTHHNKDTHQAEAHVAHAHGNWGGHYPLTNEPTLLERVFSSVLVNSFMFTGISLLALFFIAVHNVAHGGWFVQFIRICEAMGGWLFIGPVLLLVTFFVAGPEMYLWLQKDLLNDPEVLHLLHEKEGYLNKGFFLARQIAVFVLWIVLFLMLRKSSRKEDLEGGFKLYDKRVGLSAVFILLFAFSYSMASWDWLMSIESTWFSTMFGVHAFASAWVSAIAILILITVFLRNAGYLPHVSSGLMHDLGKYLFGFSVFWTYIWFSQFLLIWYANIPEEGIYFYNRLADYPFTFGLLLILNFITPFLALMTNSSKRNYNTLAAVAVIVLLGHWLDFYQMVIPGALGPFGEVGFLELGMFVTFLGAFLFLTGTMLAKAPLIPKKHPYLEESLGHTYDI
ncbi:MAG: quinol:cytochrome C oxidoreductase [Bacteroidetes bacterium]|nr:quinol:cytochrome C oxidoreductase [Bacteroidota bacterium]